MKQEYKKRTVYIIIAMAVIFSVSVLCGFFLLGKDREYEPDLPVISSTEQPIQVTAEKILPYYIIRAEQDTINLYYVKDGEEEKMRSDVFLSEVFPDRDVSKLLEGIIAESGEEAIMVWENFTS